MEKEQIEQQLNKMCQQQKESRLEIDQLKETLSKFETAQLNWERTKKTLEIEKQNLKHKCEQSEDKLSESNIQLMNFENLERRLNNSEQLLMNKNEVMSNLELDNKMLKQQVINLYYTSEM